MILELFDTSFHVRIGLPYTVFGAIDFISENVRVGVYRFFILLCSVILSGKIEKLRSKTL